jgi:hypothetical protein
MYHLVPAAGHITVVPLKPTEVKQYTSKILNDVETSGMDVLQYGRVIEGGSAYATDDIVLYAKLASDKTNFGDPRQVIVELQHVKGFIKEVDEAVSND